MLSTREVKVLVKLAIEKYARTQANYFFFKNRMNEREEEGDLKYFEDILEALVSSGVDGIPDDKVFSQPNYVDFYNTLIDSDKREEFREFCLNNDGLIKTATIQSIKKATVQLLMDTVQELNEDL